MRCHNYYFLIRRSHYLHWQEKFVFCPGTQFFAESLRLASSKHKQNAQFSHSAMVIKNN